MLFRRDVIFRKNKKVVCLTDSVISVKVNQDENTVGLIFNRVVELVPGYYRLYIFFSSKISLIMVTLDISLKNDFEQYQFQTD